MSHATDKVIYNFHLSQKCFSTSISCDRCLSGISYSVSLIHVWNFFIDCGNNHQKLLSSIVSYRRGACKGLVGWPDRKTPLARPLHYEGKSKGKGKVHPRTNHEDPEGEQRYISTLSLTLALDVGGWSTPRPGRFTTGKDPVPIV